MSIDVTHRTEADDVTEPQQHSKQDEPTEEDETEPGDVFDSEDEFDPESDAETDADLESDSDEGDDDLTAGLGDDTVMFERERISEAIGRSGSGVLGRMLREGRLDSSLVDRMVEDLATRIIDGRLPPGADVNSVELARRYGSSRTPVREALLTLQREGLVDIPARRRPRVALVTSSQVREMYEVRASLHGLVSELIVQRADNSALAVLRGWQDKLRADAEHADVEAYFWHNVAFRQAEAEVAGNHQLTRLLSTLGLRTLQLRHLSLSFPGRLDRSVDDHDRLLTAYDDRDAALATAITKSIIMAGYRAIEASAWPGLEK
jgi:DNA-binding GntR family transcriptional regulator